jgi:hypothetical protein
MINTIGMIAKGDMRATEIGITETSGATRTEVETVIETMIVVVDILTIIATAIGEDNTCMLHRR